MAQVQDVAGHACTLRVIHRTVAPGAVDATQAALIAVPSFVSGTLRRARGAWEMEPLAIAGGRISVPDLEAAQSAVEAIKSPSVDDRTELERLMDEVQHWIDSVIHNGCSPAE